MPRVISRSWLCDLLFVCAAALYAFLAMEGITMMSAGGVALDSDLATYAQTLAHGAHPANFTSDPLLGYNSPAVDIHNLQSFIARFLMPPDAPGLGLLRAGAIIIFIFYCSWYIMGRWLFKSPALAALLAVACGITVWIEYGTFWGVNHSDPVPRTFFAALFPLLLLFALIAARKPWLRPLAMLATGCGMWVHGLSALNCGAMFFCFFLFYKPENTTVKLHLANSTLSLLAFLLPVAIFLWPSMSGGRKFTEDEIAMFQAVFSQRWKTDYANSPQRLLRLVTTFNPWSSLSLAGFCCWLGALYFGSPRERLLAKACPFFIAAIGAVALFSFAEVYFAPDLGRVAMGHELVRGIRYLIPLSILMMGVCLDIFVPRLILLPAIAIAILLILIFTVDRQYAAAQYALAKRLHISLPLVENAEKVSKDAERMRRFLEVAQETIPEGEKIFMADGNMAIRHFALRPLAYAFKDGYIFYYNKDREGAAKWLETGRIFSREPDGIIQAWLYTQAPWLICKSGTDRVLLEKFGTVEGEFDGWLFVKRKDVETRRNFAVPD